MEKLKESLSHKEIEIRVSLGMGEKNISFLSCDFSPSYVKINARYSKENHKDINWKKIAGMRDKIIHYYFGVNWIIVWAVIQDKFLNLSKK